MKSSRIWRQHGMSSTVWSVTNLQFFCRESHAVCAVLSRWVFNQWKRLQLIQFDHSQGTYLNPLADKIFPVQLLAIYLQTKNYADLNFWLLRFFCPIFAALHVLKNGASKSCEAWPLEAPSTTYHLAHTKPWNSGKTTDMASHTWLFPFG